MKTVPKANIIIFCAYIILSILFTYPVLFSPDKIPGGGDQYWFLWDFWQFSKALLSGTNPYYTSYMFYPTGVSLAFSTISLFNVIIAVPLQSVFGLINVYKLIWISTFVVSGYGAFVLVRHLTDDVKAAFAAGLIFMFCPYRFAHALGHLNLISTAWIPFYVLFLLRALGENKRSNYIYAALFLFLTALSDYMYLMFMIVFSLLYLVYYLWTNKTREVGKNAVKKVGLIFALCGAVLLPFIYPMLIELASSNYMYYTGHSSVDYSADLLAFVTPSPFHPIFGRLVTPVYSHFTGNLAEYTVFVGYTVIILSILAVLRVRSKDVKFWALSAILFLVLSLGPLLHIDGKWSFGGMIIPLPYALLTHIPILSIEQVPSRWSVLVMLSLTVLSGYGLSYLFSSFKNKSFKHVKAETVISVALICLILFEFSAVPLAMSSGDVPIIYQQIAKEHGDFAIMEIPFNANMPLYANYFYYQTVHQKKLVNGYVSRTPDYALEFVKSTPFISQLATLSPNDNATAQSNATDIGPSVLKYYDIKYVILHKNYMTDEQFDFANTLLQNSLKKHPDVYENDSLVVYKVKNS